MGYDYEIKYRSSAQHANADALSRLPCGGDTNFDKEETIALITTEVLAVESQTIADFPLSAKTIADHTRKDPILSKVLDYVENGWPARCQMNDEARSFRNAQTEMSSMRGVLLRDNRVIVPTALRTKVLKLLHASHLGMTRMKSLARLHVWWPNIEADIERCCKQCKPCAETAPNQPQNLSTWPVPDKPWQRQHIDFAGPFMNMWLVVMDAHSKWTHVIKLNKYPTAETTTSTLDDLFTLWGPPETIVSDNGPQFTSVVFAEWCKRHTITHLASAPFHPPSNGEAERLVGVFKQAMKRAVAAGNTKHDALCNFLKSNRSTPNCATGRTPAELMIGRQFRSALSVLKPARKHTIALPLKRMFAIGDDIYYRNYSGRHRNWLPGCVGAYIGRRMFCIDCPDGRQCRRHIDQLKWRSEPPRADTDAVPDDVSEDVPDLPEPRTAIPTPPPRHSTRATRGRPPTRLIDTM